MADIDSIKDKLKDLIARKDKIEKEIKSLNTILVSEKDVGMKGSLVDSEQFPRNDIDIISVKHTRQSIICLQTDHKNLLKEIEQNLYLLHELSRVNNEKKSSSNELGSFVDIRKLNIQNKQLPFAIVNLVEEGSPADKAHLKVRDEIVEFGSINITNFTKLQDLAIVTQNHKGSEISVSVLRDDKLLKLVVVPSPWNNKGLLGCNILPIKK